MEKKLTEEQEAIIDLVLMNLDTGTTSPNREDAVAFLTALAVMQTIQILKDFRLVTGGHNLTPEGRRIGKLLEKLEWPITEEDVNAVIASQNEAQE